MYEEEEQMKKLLRIDLTNNRFGYKGSPFVYANLGGRGLTSKIISQEVPARTDALGKENKLVFAGGILAGSMVLNSGAFCGGEESSYQCNKRGERRGTAAQKLARLGIQAVVVEGASPELCIVKVSKDGVTLFRIILSREGQLRDN